MQISFIRLIDVSHITYLSIAVIKKETKSTHTHTQYEQGTVWKEKFIWAVVPDG